MASTVMRTIGRCNAALLGAVGCCVGRSTRERRRAYEQRLASMLASVDSATVDAPDMERLPVDGAFMDEVRLVRALGEGSSGTVFLGRWGDRNVAVKVCRLNVVRTAPRCMVPGVLAFAPSAASPPSSATPFSGPVPPLRGSCDAVPSIVDEYVLEYGILRRLERAEARDRPAEGAVASARFARPHRTGRFVHGARNVWYAFVMMEHIDGTVLGRLIERARAEARPLSPAFVRAVVTDLVRAADALHRAGYVHNDWHSDNVIVTRRDRRAVLIDFNAAEPVTRRGRRADHEGIVALALVLQAAHLLDDEDEHDARALMRAHDIRPLFCVDRTTGRVVAA
jgi:serine/threonine protein kinase